MTQVTFVILGIAAVLFMYRLCAGPSLADRVVALNGVVLVGMAGIATHAAHTGVGAFLPTLVAIALVGPISNGMIARYIEGRQP
ncbi:MAG TPA: monovalent cation/H+ antiporter complex subunit F [Acidimicrobiales bacterium]|nr:monovalent cation/H+ antiporter complex subunit F [Acidimicrobiales bacterium]